MTNEEKEFVRACEVALECISDYQENPTDGHFAAASSALKAAFEALKAVFETASTFEKIQEYLAGLRRTRELHRILNNAAVALQKWNHRVERIDA